MHPVFPLALIQQRWREAYWVDAKYDRIAGTSHDKTNVIAKDTEKDTNKIVEQVVNKQKRLTINKHVEKEDYIWTELNKNTGESINIKKMWKKKDAGSWLIQREHNISCLIKLLGHHMLPEQLQ